MELVLEALAAPFLEPTSRTFWPGLLVALGVGLGLHRGRTAGWRAVLLHPSSGLDVQLLVARQLLQALGWGTGLVSAAAIGALVGRGLARLGPSPVVLPEAVWVVLYTAALFVAWDLSRFVVHMGLHKAPWLWSFHQVHHSAEVLTPLTFHRVHPVESVVYGLRGAVVTGGVAGVAWWLSQGQARPWELAGVPAVGVLLNVTLGNLRHSHVWVPFPPSVERLLLSPAQHQRHHARDGQPCNYGTWLAVWDRACGTWRPSGEPVRRFGLDHPNHGHELLSAWWGPVWEVWGGRASGAPGPLAGSLASLAPPAAPAACGAAPVPAAAEHKAARARNTLLIAALLVAPTPARADDTEATEEEPATELEGFEVLVYDEDGVPRVAGAAQVVDQATLERLEQDDPEKVLAGVPGVTARTEDGFGLRPNIGIRGASSDRSAKVTLLEDGVPFAPAPYAAPAAYYFPMSTRMVGVEVFKGAAATRQGPQTVGGAINLLTRPVGEASRGELDLAVGSYLALKAHGWGALARPGAGLLLEGVHLHSDGFKELDGGGPTGFDRTELMLKGTWSPAAAHRLVLKLGYARESSHETYLGLTAADLAATPYRRYPASTLDHMAWDRTQAALSWDARAGQALRFHSVAWHHWLDRSWTKLNGLASGLDVHDLLQVDPAGGQGAVALAVLRGEIDTPGPDQELLIGTNHRTFHSGGVQSAVRWLGQGERLRAVVDGGARLMVDDVVRLHTEGAYTMTGGLPVPTGAPEETTLDARSGVVAGAGHLHADLGWGPLHVVPGGRLEAIGGWRVDHEPGASDEEIRRSFDVVPLPGLAVLAEVGARSQVFAGVHRGFSPVAPGSEEGVEPELAWSQEVGGRYTDGRHHLEAAAFFTDYQNLVGQCTISGGCDADAVDDATSAGRVLVWGAEAVGGSRADLPAGLALAGTANFSWIASRFLTSFSSDFPQFGDVEAGDALPYVPRTQARLSLALEHAAGHVQVGGTWRGAMLDVAGAFPAIGSPVAESEVPGALLFDATAGARVAAVLEVYATGTNLLGSTALASWRPYGARPVAPRVVMAGVKWRGPSAAFAP